MLMVGEAEVFDLEVPVLYNTWIDDSIFERLLTDPATGGVLEPRNPEEPGRRRCELRFRALGGDPAFIAPSVTGSTSSLLRRCFAALVEQKVLCPWPREEHDAAPIECGGGRSGGSSRWENGHEGGSFRFLCRQL